MPQGWEWTRVSSACIINPRNSLDDKLQVSFIPMSFIQEGFSNKHFSEVKEWGKVKSGFTHFSESDIGIAKITPCFENRKSVIFSNLENGYGAGTTELHILRAINILPEYILCIVKSEDFISKGIQAFTGAVGQQRIGKEYISNYMIPIPSLTEQKRIINKINEIFNSISSIKSNKIDLQTTIQLAKSKILDLAIRGKLVPQDPTDEPANVLLERIRAEKEELIKQGKIKRDKKESVIFKGEDNSYYEKIGNMVRCIDDELPFELPDGWTWARLSSSCMINPRNIVNDEILTSFVPMTLIQDGYSNSFTYEQRKWKDIKKGYTHFAENDVGFAKISPCFENRKSVVFSDLCNGYGAGTTELYIIRTYSDTILPNYILNLVKSDSFIYGGKQTFSGAVGQQRVNKEYVYNYLCPVPPLAEQRRIIAKCSEMMQILHNIEKSLS